jgi:glycosyltransferase A (GT-A) superfamily protein (DUF2064 family)
MTTLVVIAKEPIPGRVKTRLHPPLSYEQAAQLAAASIDDTLSSLSELPASRRILLFDGTVIPDAARDYEVVPQRDGDLDERLAAIFDLVDEPMLLVGMDTPQITARHLSSAFTNWPSSVDAWFGPSSDGGWWALGMRHPDGDLIRGIPTSRDDTGGRQKARLLSAGLSVGMLPMLTDVDTIEDALEVADAAPLGRFAATLATFAPTLDLQIAS